MDPVLSVQVRVSKNDTIAKKKLLIDLIGIKKKRIIILTFQFL